jgi:hypothetical protein
VESKWQLGAQAYEHFSEVDVFCGKMAAGKALHWLEDWPSFLSSFETFPFFTNDVARPQRRWSPPYREDHPNLTPA